MADTTLPLELFRRVSATEHSSREAAWDAFVRDYSRLLFHVARSLGGDRDAVMDRYAWVLEQLHQDDCRRLRAYVPDGRTKFSTWLTVVARRLCLDHYRHRYGRARDSADETNSSLADRRARRSLADLVTRCVDVSELTGTDERAEKPDSAVRASELHLALEQVLERLEPADRLLLRLRFEDELSIPEIARVTGARNPFVVYRRISLVLRSLRRALQQRGVRSSTP